RDRTRRRHACPRSVTPGPRPPPEAGAPARSVAQLGGGPVAAPVGAGRAALARAETGADAVEGRDVDIRGIGPLHAPVDRRPEVEQLLEVALALRRDEPEAQELHGEQETDPEDEERVRCLVPRVLDRAREPVVAERRLVAVLLGDVPH